MTYWIGKTNADVLGYKKPISKMKLVSRRYLLGTLSTSKQHCETVTEFLAGFAGYKIVEIKIVEVRRKKK